MLVGAGRARARGRGEQLWQCWPVPVLVSGTVARYKVEWRPLAVWAHHHHHHATATAHSLFHLFGWRRGEREQRTAVSSQCTPRIFTSAVNRLIGEVVQSRRRPLLGLLLVESGYYRFHI